MRALAIRQGIWSTLLQVARVGASSVVFLVLARVLPLEDIGAYSVAFAVTQLAQALIKMGVLETVVASSRDDDAYLGTAHSVVMLGGAGLTLVLAALAGVLGLVLADVRVGAYLLALSILPLTEALGVVPDAVLRRTLQFKPLAMRTTIAVSAAGLAAVAAAYLGLGGWSLAALPVVSSILSSVLALAMCGRKISFRWDPAAHEITVTSLRLSLSGFASASLVPTTQIAVGALAGASAAGAYSLAQRIVGLLMALTVEPARNVALPLMSRMGEDLEARRRAIVEGLGLITTVMAPLYSGLYVVAPIALPWLLGENGAQSVGAVRVLCWMYLPVAMFGIATQLLIALRKPEIVFSYTMWQALANLAISLLLAGGGAVLTAWGYVLRAYALVPLVLRRVGGHGGVPAMAFLTSTVPAGGAGLAMAFLTNLVAMQPAVRALHGAVATAVVLILGGLLYPLLLRLIAPSHFAVARRMFESLLRKARSRAEPAA